MKVINVRGVAIGEGTPKICVPLVGKTLQELIDEARYLLTIECDIVEWRVDHFQNVEKIHSVLIALAEIRNILQDIPLLFTFRSKKEGGEKEISGEDYEELNRAVIQTGHIDLVDVELFNDKELLRDIIKIAHTHNVAVIVSNHDFDKTPPKEEVLARLKRARDLGGDIPKIAVMPTEPKDVLTLLDATLSAKEQLDCPIITMAMDGVGIISRLSGEIFGSTVTFGAAKKASAPGQIPAIELRKFLTLLHKHQKQSD